MAQIICPNCGGSLESTASTCTYCGTALAPAPVEQVSASAPTMLSDSLNAIVSPFNSSAEAMDEVKRLLREKDKAGAVQVYRDYFKVSLKVAKQAVDQTETDLQHAPEPVVEPAPAAEADTPTTFSPVEPVVEPVPAAPEPPKPASRPKWLIGGVAAVLFLCCCCCLPLIGVIVWVAQNR